MTISETVAPATVQTADVTSPIVQDNATQPLVTSPVVEVQPVVDAAAVDPAAPVAPVAPLVNEEAPKVTPKWAQDRINELTAKRHDAERRAQSDREAREALEEIVAKMTTKTPAGTQTAPAETVKPQMSDEEIDRKVQQRASEMARVAEFNKTCDQIAETGEKEFKDWGDALKNLGLVGAVGQGANPEFLETVVELKQPHKVLHYLGTNLEQAERIAKLPPKKMALEMARLEATINAPAPVVPVQVSQAPAPINPIGGAAKITPGDINDPNISPEDWFMLRAKQVEDKRNRYRKA